MVRVGFLLGRMNSVEIKPKLRLAETIAGVRQLFASLRYPVSLSSNFSNDRIAKAGKPRLERYDSEFCIHFPRPARRKICCNNSIIPLVYVVSTLLKPDGAANPPGSAYGF